MLSLVKSTVSILKITLEQTDSTVEYCGVKRSATITLTNGYFDECRFEVGCDNHYNYEDWMFLAAVADEIRNQCMLTNGVPKEEKKISES